MLTNTENGSLNRTQSNSFIIIPMTEDMMKKTLIFGRYLNFRHRPWFGNIIGKNRALKYIRNKVYEKSIKLTYIILFMHYK